MALGGGHQASFVKTILWVRSFVSAGGHTLVEYPPGMPLEAKLLTKNKKGKIGIN